MSKRFEQLMKAILQRLRRRKSARENRQVPVETASSARSERPNPASSRIVMTPLPDKSAPTAAASTAGAVATIHSPFRPIDHQPSAGEFRDESHTHLGLTRRYKLYIPSARRDQALPLLVMLHGCTQDPDDFAAGTAMNELADEQGFYVLYPRQSLEANPSRCWNWFNHHHQQRGRGEPALIADLTLALLAQNNIDRQRIYVAGLSAGGAMAAIIAAAYPESYAAVGVHSGIARGSAINVLEAIEVMKRGPAASGFRLAANGVGFTSAAASARARLTMPTIVFHGDADETVHPSNGARVIEAVVDTIDVPGKVAVATGESGGRRFTRTMHHDPQQNVVAEHWLVHGAGHAWSGGQDAGSHADPAGPDASREMLRFFFAHPMGEGNS